jgi:hypothetical protein
MRALIFIRLEFILCTLILGAIGLMGNHLIYALPIPANYTITDTLKSIISNVSTSIQSDIDKVI